MDNRNLYRLDDEPRPGALARLAVEPLWPLLGLMLGGAWLGLPWFVLNGMAVGSPTRVREAALAAIGLLGSLGLAFGLLYLWQGGILDKGSLQYAMLVLVVWKLAIGYALFVMQASTIELYQYYGGVLNRFGLPVVLLGAFFLRGMVLNLLPFTLWFLVLS
ncbi:hypothetical protein [Pseudomonas sp. TUM22785]|uniref:hypothetical protein n=1 Tax=Pseudomonas sp. TUM22785 TaxID=3019098 RepID=UPI000395FB82|nr:hypothetical protein [Pseudomonas sp. TUM22785]EQM71360.1 hypothetical protein L682_30845 [Pseudomonas alcaligenes OT 69]MDN4148524.1 hypothetical protein [Pseudomonas tohonis]WCD82213.1 hypothetical protein PI990_09435 [Pseudomonas sp. TUM22785]